MLGICFLQEAPERAIESDRRAWRFGLSRERGMEEGFRCAIGRCFGKKKSKSTPVIG
jgi:hypothetical protein